jgi:hypothetical protein
VDPDDPRTVQADLEATVKAITERLGAVTATDAAEAVRRRLLSTTRPEPISPLAQSLAADRLGPDDLVRLRAHSHPRLEDGSEGKVRLVTTTRTVAVPAGCRAALGVLLDGRSHAVRDLPGLDPADARTLVVRLLREGIVVPG